MSGRPKLFISSDDPLVAQGLAQVLDGEGFDAWLKPKGYPDTDLRDSIERTIRECDGVVFLVTGSSNANPWVKQEWEAALTASWENPGPKLIPVVAPGAQPPGFLRDRTWIRLPTSDAKTADWSRVAREVRNTLVHGGERDAYYREQARQARHERLEKMRIAIAPLVQAEMSKAPVKD